MPTPSELDEEATSILERDRDSYSSAVEYGREYGILFHNGFARRYRREMSVGLYPDPAIRAGLYSRATNSRQIWLNGWLTGRTNGRNFPMKHPSNEPQVRLRLSGGSFQGAP
jgi:hypothetical protein